MLIQIAIAFAINAWSQPAPHKDFSDNELSASIKKADVLLARKKIEPLCEVLKRDSWRDFNIKLHITKKIAGATDRETVECLLGGLRKHNEATSWGSEISMPKAKVKEAIIVRLRELTKKPLPIELWAPVHPQFKQFAMDRETTSETNEIIREVEKWIAAEK